MKPDIHPDYVEATVRCSCGNTYVTHSTKADLHVELCNECHPFFTGKQKLVDSGGRVERFQRRYGARKGKAKAAPAAASAGLSPVSTRSGAGRPASPLLSARIHVRRPDSRARVGVRRGRGRPGRPGRPGGLRSGARSVPASQGAG